MIDSIRYNPAHRGDVRSPCELQRMECILIYQSIYLSILLCVSALCGVGGGEKLLYPAVSRCILLYPAACRCIPHIPLYPAVSGCIRLYPLYPPYPTIFPFIWGPDLMKNIFQRTGGYTK